MERKLRFLEKEIKKDDIPMLDAGTYEMHINNTNPYQGFFFSSNSNCIIISINIFLKGILPKLHNRGK